MNKQYYVSGNYQARYPNGYHTGEAGLSTHVTAKSKRAAKKAALHKAMKLHGYIQFDWLDVKAQQVQ